MVKLIVVPNLLSQSRNNWSVFETTRLRVEVLMDSVPSPTLFAYSARIFWMSSPFSYSRMWIGPKTSALSGGEDSKWDKEDSGLPIHLPHFPSVWADHHLWGARRRVLKEAVISPNASAAQLRAVESFVFRVRITFHRGNRRGLTMRWRYTSQQNAQFHKERNPTSCRSVAISITL